MFSFKQKPMKIPTAAEALPGRATPLPTPRPIGSTATPSSRRSRRGWRRRSSGSAASGVRSGILAAARRLCDRGRLCRRPDAQPDLPGSLQRHDRPQRGRAGGLRPDEGQLRSAAEDLLGKPRSDPGHAPGQRCRHPVPLRHLRHVAGAAPHRGRVAQGLPAGPRKAGYGAITTEILDAPPFYYAEDYHQQYLAKNPNGYCGLGGTGVSCPIGVTGGVTA